MFRNSDADWEKHARANTFRDCGMTRALLRIIDGLRGTVPDAPADDPRSKTLRVEIGISYEALADVRMRADLQASIVNNVTQKLQDMFAEVDKGYVLIPVPKTTISVDGIAQH